MIKLRTEKEIIKNWSGNLSDPLVSINCMAYNHELYIEDALKGFLIQKTDFPFEILIHDDASTDETARIIRGYTEEYPNLIKPIYQNENQYSKGNRPGFMNQKRANGKYIAFCEGDDYWTDPLKLHKQVRILEKNPEIVMVYTDISYVDQHGDLIQRPFFDLIAEKVSRRPIKVSGNILKALSQNNFIMTLAIMVRNDIQLKVISELDKITCFIPIDYALFFEIAAMGPVYYLDDKTGSYRVLLDSMSQRSNLTGRIKFATNTSKIARYYNTKYSLGVSDYYYDSRVLKSILIECSKFKERGKFIRYFLRGVRNDFRIAFIVKIYLFYLLSFIPNWSHQQ